MVKALDFSIVGGSACRFDPQHGQFFFLFFFFFMIMMVERRAAVRAKRERQRYERSECRR